MSIRDGGSFRQPGGTTNNSIKFAGEESKDKMYEPKHTKKVVRVLTVVAYVFSVSLAAIMLSIYYVFLWNPRDAHLHVRPNASAASAATATTTTTTPAPAVAGPVVCECPVVAPPPQPPAPRAPLREAGSAVEPGENVTTEKYGTHESTLKEPVQEIPGT